MTNVGTGTLTLTIKASVSWLDVGPVQANMGPNKPDKLWMRLKPEAPEGRHSATVNVTSNRGQ